MFKVLAFCLLVCIELLITFVVGVPLTTSLTYQSLLCGIVFLYAYYPQTHLRSLPAPPAKLWTGNITQVSNWDKVMKICREYGPIWRLLYGRDPYVVITDSNVIKEILSDDFHSNFHSRPGYRDFGLFDGEHLFSQPYEAWKSSRRAITPAFNTMNLTRFASLISEAGRDLTIRLRQAVDNNEEVEIWSMFQSVTLQVITSTSFGEGIKYTDKLGAELGKAMSSLFEYDEAQLETGMSLFSTLPFLGFIIERFPFGDLKRKFGYREFVDQTTRSMVQKLRQGSVSEEKKKTFLNLLISAVDNKTGRKFSDKEILDQSYLFMVAGFETTANSLAFATYNITKHPDVLKKLQEEIAVNFPGELEEITYSDLKKFTYLDMVIQESLRMYPPIAIITLIREATKDVSILGHKIPKGTRIAMPPYVLHRDEKIFPDPDTFRPERWDPLCEESQKRHRFAWVPFGEGPRKCIGYRFALEELKIILINVFKHFTFEMGSKPLKLAYPFTTLSPSGGLHLIPKEK